MPNSPESGRASSEPVALTGSEEEVDTPAARLLFALTAAGLLADGFAAPILGGAVIRLDMLLRSRKKRERSRGEANAIKLSGRVRMVALSM